VVSEKGGNKRVGRQNKVRVKEDLKWVLERLGDTKKDWKHQDNRKETGARSIQSKGVGGV